MQGTRDFGTRPHAVDDGIAQGNPGHLNAGVRHDDHDPILVPTAENPVDSAELRRVGPERIAHVEPPKRRADGIGQQLGLKRGDAQ
jgi:hypothetical protein